MINATVNLDLYRYEIHSLIKAFYPEEDVKVLLTGEGKQEAQEIFMEILFLPEEIVMRLPETGVQMRTAAQGDRYDIKCPAGKAAMKHMLYRMLTQHTGRELPWGELIGIRPTKLAMAQLEKGATVEETARYMETEHKVSPEKAQLAARIAAKEKKLLSPLHAQGGYSIYVGIPFCPTTCLYCSFTSFPIGAWKDRADLYLDTLEKEIESAAALMQGRTPDTLYIGGGTPTTLEPLQLERLITTLRRNFPLDDLLEFTVEAGRPDSITRDKLRVLRECGVKRISVNPQTMLEKTLRLIGRQHTVDDVRRAFYMAREEGFDNINMDIILGLPEETEEDVQYTLSEIEKLGPDSLTAHSLAVKRASRLHKYIEQNGFSSIRNTDRCVRMAAQSAAAMGMEPYYLYRQKNMSGNYENVGYAREGKEGLYNVLIMEEIQTILALGAGSITKGVFPGGRIERSDNCKDVATYIRNIDEMNARKERLFHKNQ
ncbi:MAG: coproporphyrinogen dehydrogenase HemZ [Lachnospiraceae bacterium]|nr:coproporphyrinogen dehydrogenase HemZ [Lachnospiraceae bacterium]